MAFCVYVLLGSSGYSTYGSHVEHDILANYPATNWLVALARLAISFVVMCCYPLQAHPTRACITSIVKALGGAELDEGKVNLPPAPHVIFCRVAHQPDMDDSLDVCTCRCT